MTKEKFIKEKLQGISARLNQDEIAEILRICEKRNMSQASVVRMLVSVGLEVHKDMESLGIIGIVDLAYYVKEAIKTKVASGRQLTLPMMK